MQPESGDRLQYVETILQRITERQDKAAENLQKWDLEWKRRMDRAEQRMDRHDKRMAAADRKWEQRWAKNEERWAKNEERWARTDARMAITDKQLQATRKLLEGGIKFVSRLSLEIREVSRLQKAMLRSQGNGHHGRKHG
jgi:DNA repair exonuclease SbcCD ATPase subunit